MRRLSKAEVEQYLKGRKDAKSEMLAFLKALSAIECEEGDFIAKWRKEAADKAILLGTRSLSDKDKMLLVISYLDMVGIDSGVCNVVGYLCGGTE